MLAMAITQDLPSCLRLLTCSLQLAVASPADVVSLIMCDSNVMCMSVALGATSHDVSAGNTADASGLEGMISHGAASGSTSSSLTRSSGATCGAHWSTRFEALSPLDCTRNVPEKHVDAVRLCHNREPT